MPRYFPLKAFGIETQIPRWAASILAAVLIAAIVWTVCEEVVRGCLTEQQMKTIDNFISEQLNDLILDAVRHRIDKLSNDEFKLLVYGVAELFSQVKHEAVRRGVWDNIKQRKVGS